jgi:hypothetical protein
VFGFSAHLLFSILECWLVDVQDNFYSTRTSEGLHSQTPVFSSSLICTTNSKKCRYARSSPGRLQPQLHTNSGTWIPQGMGFKSKFDLLQPHAAESDTTLTSRSMDSDSVEDESLETSTGSNIEDLLSVSGEDSDVQSRGKAGFVSFHSPRLGKEQHRSTPFQNIIGPVYDNKRNWSSVLWLIGPLALVCSVVGPPLYLRRFFESILEDSLLTGESLIWKFSGIKLCRFLDECNFDTEFLMSLVQGLGCQSVEGVIVSLVLGSGCHTCVSQLGYRVTHKI